MVGPCRNYISSIVNVLVTCSMGWGLPSVTSRLAQYPGSWSAVVVVVRFCAGAVVSKVAIYNTGTGLYGSCPLHSLFDLWL